MCDFDQHEQSREETETDTMHTEELRRGTDPEGVPVNNALAAVYLKLGLPELAEQAAARAALTRARHPA